MPFGFHKRIINLFSLKDTKRNQVQTFSKFKVSRKKKIMLFYTFFPQHIMTVITMYDTRNVHFFFFIRRTMTS